MPRAVFYFISFCILTAVLTSAVRAQEAISQGPKTAENPKDENEAVRPEYRWKFERGSKEINVEFGFAPMQPTFFSGRKEYDTNGRKLALVSFKWGRVIGTAKGVTFEYFFEAAPLAIAIENEVANPRFVSRAETPREPKTIRTNTYGVSIKPAGFKFTFRPHKRLKPFVRLGAGFIFTNKPVPVPESPNYNFIGDFGGGLIYSITPRHAINFGYRYFHISNMNIGKINPGYNANIFYIGVSRFYK